MPYGDFRNNFVALPSLVVRSSSIKDDGRNTFSIISSGGTSRLAFLAYSREASQSLRRRESITSNSAGPRLGSEQKSVAPGAVAPQAGC